MSVYLNLKTNQLFKKDYEKYKHITTYKHQIMCLLIESLAGVVPDINNSKRIDEYCQKIYNIIKDEDNLKKHLDESITLFEQIKSKWITDRGQKFKYAIKDNADFTKFMLTYLRGGNIKDVINDINDESLRGTVTTVKKDRNGLFYGYIKHSPSDVFIHQDDNPHIRFYDLVGKDVVYTTTESNKFGTFRGKIKYVVQDSELKK